MQTITREKLLHQLQELSATGLGFAALARSVFEYQAQNNPIYSRFLQLLDRNPVENAALNTIPFLPISFFKTHTIQTGDWEAETVFSSSGTTGQIASRHLVRDSNLYLDNCLYGFEQQYGDPQNWIVLALLPAYLERMGSSLVVMADYFIRRSQYPQSGFFLNNLQELRSILAQRPAGVPVLLLGVSFALLDLAEQYPMDLSGVTIMETGGMKGRRKELTRNELHQQISSAFQTPLIHSEYGMTELFSQGYAKGGTLFTPSKTMRVFTTEINDPFCATAPGKTGLINIIDLANIDTCSFIATEDLGRVYSNGQFEVLGRLDTAEMRGCNLMVE